MDNKSSSDSQMKALLAAQGYVFLTNLPADFDHLDLLSRFGTLVPQYDGRTVWSIKADARFDDLYHSLNTKELYPHTECYEMPGLPPRFLALWCISPAACGGGSTTLADGYAFVTSLTKAERLVLKKEFPFVSSAGIQASALGKTATHPVYDESGPSPIFRFSFNCMSYHHDPVMVGIAKKCVAFFNTTCRSFEWHKNDLLLWDNYRMLHSRTGFEDRSRELKRVWLSY